MSAQLPESAKDLTQRPIVCTFITVMPDGQPQATPVWFDFDGTHFRINTAEGRQKARNIARNSKVTLTVIDPQNPFHWIEVRGQVNDIKTEEEGGRDHINSLSMKYRGNPVYQGQVPNERRLMIFIEPTKINGQ